MEFYRMVCVFLTRLGFNPPTPYEWSRIEALADSGDKILAIKELRESVKEVLIELPEPGANCAQNTEWWKFVCENGTKKTTKRLSLREAKDIVEWLMHDKCVFDVFDRP